MTQHGQEEWQIAAETVAEMFADAVRRYPDNVYCKTSTNILTYAQAGNAVQALADRLRARVAGQPVALVLPNSDAFLIAYFAILFAGGKPALLNYTNPTATLDKLLADLKPAQIISDREFLNAPTLVLDADLISELASPTNDDDMRPVGNGADIAAILYSGGTTGLPKQVPHSNAALIAKIERAEWGWPSNEDEIWLPVAPFTHVYGYLMGLTNPVLRGGTVILPDRFQPDLVVDLLRQEKVTIFGGGPPAIYQALMAAENFGASDFANLRSCPGGGAPFPLDLHRRWKETTGLTLLEGYGMTEIAPISINTVEHGVKPGSAGKAIPDTVIEIVDLETGKQILPPNMAGEIRVKGPHLMTEYVNNPEETAQTLRDGYVYTGDIGELDENGFLTITDRKKDVIFVKGFNAFPREIEETLLSHPAIAGACVVGKTHERSGETPVAYVSLRSDVTEQAIADYCKDHLVGYKVPSEFHILDALPLTPNGKVDRLALWQKAAGQ